MDVMFHQGTQISPWYVVIYENNYAPGSGVTYAGHGYTECTAYSEATRPEFVESAASAGSLGNAAPNRAIFTMTASKTIYGVALVGGGGAASTKGDTAGGGALYCAVSLGTPISVVSGDYLSFKITLTQSGA